MPNLRNVKSKDNIHLASVKKSEGRAITVGVRSTTGGSIILVSAGSASTTTFNSVAATAGTANVWNSISGVTSYAPTPGFALVIRQITISTDIDCHIGLQHSVTFGTDSTRHAYGLTGTLLQNTFLRQESKRQYNSTGGEVVFTFPDSDPLIVKHHERLDFVYSRNDTTGVRGVCSVDGFEIIDDFNYTADKTMLVLGDSISGITNVAYAGEDSYWSHNIRNRYLAKGIDTRLVNIAIPGTTVADWEYFIKGGRLNGMRYDIVYINCGVNDSNVIGLGAVSGVLSSGGANSGTDGKFKTSFKNIIKRLVGTNKSMPVIINGVTPNNKTSTVTNSPSVRLEQQGVVTDMNTLGYNLTYVDLSNIFTNTDTTKFIVGENSANLGLHPNDVGQQAMATQIWSTVQNITF